MLVLGVDEVLVLVLLSLILIEFINSLHAVCVRMMGEGLPLLVHASDAGKLDERPAGVT